MNGIFIWGVSIPFTVPVELIVATKSFSQADAIKLVEAWLKARNWDVDGKYGKVAYFGQVDVCE